MSRRFVVGALVASSVVMSGLMVAQGQSRTLPYSPIDADSIVGAGVPEDCEPVAGQPGCVAGTPPGTTACGGIAVGGICTGVGWCSGGLGYDRCQASWGWGSCTEWIEGCPRQVYICGITGVCVPGDEGPSPGTCGTTYQCN